MSKDGTLCAISALNTTVSDEDISSEISVPVSTRATSGSTSGKHGSQKSSSSKGKEKSSTARSKSAKFSDLQDLESKLVGEIDKRLQSFDSNFDRIFGALSTLQSDSVQRRSSENLDSGTSGARRPEETIPNPENSAEGRSPRISLDNGLDEQFGLQRHVNCDLERQDDELSLQPGQRERQTIGLLSSDGSVSSDIERNDNNVNRRFQKYTVTIPNTGSSETNQTPLTHDMLKDMFGEDAIADSKSSKGLALDKSQIDTISETLRCQAPDKLSAYKDSFKQSFPVQDCSEKLLQVPSLDELTERLLIKKHGRRAAFGSSQSLFSQPYKSIEKIAFQGQVASRMGIVSVCYAQQALGLLLRNLQSTELNVDEAIQNVRDLFAISTKSLDQLSRTGAFFHLIR
ncbi:MAG: hypothetical protein N0C90_16985, partial [Candidatus Thiodiazotropha endolucinida]|nr:hypothetical protein [Candidatus Thiodiazotropha taylori]MCW4263051.1 hypothetical protein [Candidatus Thiodiazotropha endolucinida]